MMNSLETQAKKTIKQEVKRAAHYNVVEPCSRKRDPYIRGIDFVDRY